MGTANFTQLRDESSSAYSIPRVNQVVWTSFRFERGKKEEIERRPSTKISYTDNVRYFKKLKNFQHRRSIIRFLSPLHPHLHP